MELVQVMLLLVIRIFPAIVNSVFIVMIILVSVLSSLMQLETM